MLTSIVIPLYNEEKRLPVYLPLLIQVIEQYFDCNSYEVIFVDDGSSDRTYEIVRSLSLEKSLFRVVSYSINKGKGYAIKKGVESAQGEKIFFSDLDMSVDWKVVPEVLTLLDSYDVVITSRRLPGSIIVLPQKPHRILFGWLYVFISNVLLGTSYSDITCGFKGFTRASAVVLFAHLTSERWSFDAEILYRAKKMNLHVCEIPVRWKNDFNSKVSLSKDIFRSFKELMRIRFLKD